MSDGRKFRTPERYSQHTIRVKASTLKTCVGVRCIYKNAEPGLEEVNNVRFFLGLSPVRQIQRDSQIWKVLDLVG